jgi:pimeloyl-ACP methyl ester carboxylesterase
VTPPEPIEVRRYGCGGPLVAVLHGGPGALGSAASLAGDLTDGFTVLEPRQRRSGGPALTVAGHVADLAAVLPDGAALVGHSWGAMLALSFAGAHPGRARSLALVGCGTYDTATREAFQRAVGEKLGAEGRRRLDQLGGRIEAASSSAESDHLLGLLRDLMQQAMAHEPLSGFEDPVEVDGRGHGETWADVVRLQAEGVEPAAFAAISCPVLMLHGDDDPHPGPATCALLRQFVPQLQYRGFPRCGHRPWAERWAREPFLAALREWLVSTAGEPALPAGR